MFDTLESNNQVPSDSLTDTLKNAFSHFDVESLDSSHQKSFWFNAYNFYLEEMTYNRTGYLDLDEFYKKSFLIANRKMTSKELIQKIASYHDPRLVLGLDFSTTTSSRTRDIVLITNSDQMLDSLCTNLINDQTFVRVKKDIKQVFYPQHFDWQLKYVDSTISSKQFVLKYHKNSNLAAYKFKPYPFSTKLRSVNSTPL